MALGRPALSADAVKERILRIREAAEQLFASEGVAMVSMRAIADQVGMSVMALYRYFPNGKEEILTSIRAGGFEMLSGLLQQAHARFLDPIDQILCAASTMLVFAMERRALYRLMFDMREIGDGEEYLAEQRRAVWANAVAPFHRAIDQGQLRGDAAILPHIFFALMHGAIGFELSKQPYPLRRLNRLVVPAVENFLRGAGAHDDVVSKVAKHFLELGAAGSERVPASS